MKKTSFFKLFLVGAFALTLGFVGCNNGPSKAEYEQLCKDLDALEETVGTMKTKLDAINGYVVAIEHEEGSNTFTVVYSNNTRQPILIPPGGGDDDPLGRTYVNEEGFWVVEDEETEYRPLTAEDLAAFLTAEDLAAMMGQIPTPRVSDDGKNWEFPYFEDGEFKWATGPAIRKSAYVEENDGEYTLWITTKDSPDTLVSIPLNSASTFGGAIAKVTLMGWATYGDATGAANISVRDIYNYTTNGYENNIGTSNLFQVNYSWIEEFWVDTDADPLEGEDHLVLDEDYVWLGGARTYAVNSVINTLEKEHKGFIVQVFPSDADFSNESKSRFTVQNTKGEILPFRLGDPILLKGYLTNTRAGAPESAVYFIPAENPKAGDPADYNLTGVDATTTPRSRDGFWYDEGEEGDSAGDGTWPRQNASENVPANYINSFEAGVLYSIVVDNIYHSNYAIESRSHMVISRESAVDRLKTSAANAQYQAEDMNARDQWEISTDVVYTFEFEDQDDPTALETDGSNDLLDIHEGTTPAEIDATPSISPIVVDYWIETSSDYNISDKIYNIVWTDGEGKPLTANPKNEAGKVRAQGFKLELADEVTLVPFNMNVWKLGVDGRVYLEKVAIMPTREIPRYTYRVYEYLIEGAEGSSDTDGDRLMPPMVIDLQEMLDYFEEEEFIWANPVAGNVPLFEYWQDNEYGVHSYRLLDVKKNGESQVGTPTWTNDWLAVLTTTAEHPIVGNTKADGTGTKIIFDGENMWNAKSMVFTPPYATNDTNGNTPVFGEDDGVYDTEWTLEFGFYVEIEGNEYLVNYLDVLFMPTIPEQDALYVRNPAYWTGDVLQAYYYEPALPWAASFAPTQGANGATNTSVHNTSFDVHPGAWTSALAGSAGGDGGFLSFVDGVEFELVNPVPNFNKNNTTATGALVRNNYVQYNQDDVTGTGVDYSFYLYNQYIATINEPAGIDFDGNGVTAETGLTNVPYDLVKQLDPNNAIFNAAPYDWNAYKKVMRVAPTQDYLYLNYYVISAATRNAMGYDVQVMSALKEGGIEPGNYNTPTVAGTDAIVLDAASAATEMIDNTKIRGYKYNTTQKYDIFQVWGPDIPAPGTDLGADLADASDDGAVYAYRYIDKVQFFVPQQHVQDYKLVTDNVNEPLDNGAAYIPQATGEKGYIRVVPLETTNRIDATLEVRVFDRFGQVKIEFIPLVIMNATTGQ